MERKEGDMDTKNFPILCKASGKRTREPLQTSNEVREKTSCTAQDHLAAQHSYYWASFLIRTTTGTRIFSNPCRFASALLSFPLGKYIRGGGNSCSGQWISPNNCGMGTYHLQSACVCPVFLQTKGMRCYLPQGRVGRRQLPLRQSGASRRGD